MSYFIFLLLGSSAVSSTLARAAFLPCPRIRSPIVGNTASHPRFPPACGKEGCNLESREGSLCNQDVLPARESLGGVRSSRLEFLDRVAAGLGVSTAAVAAAFSSPTASYAGARKTAEDVKEVIREDFLSRRYYITGELTPSLYRPDCLFTDPTTRVASVEKYVRAIKLLFDPDNAQVDLLSLEVKDDSHIFAEWRLQGYLKFPWHPYVKPYTGTTLYTLDSEGLITRHEETWSITALDAALATITPTSGP